MRPAELYEWNGQTYRGQRAVAQAAGVTRHTVSRHLNRYGTLDRLTTIPRGSSMPVTIGAHSWPSRRRLAIEMGVWDHVLRKWLRDGDMDAIRARLPAYAREDRHA